MQYIKSMPRWFIFLVIIPPIIVVMAVMIEEGLIQQQVQDKMSARIEQRDSAGLFSNNYYYCRDPFRGCTALKLFLSESFLNPFILFFASMLSLFLTAIWGTIAVIAYKIIQGVRHRWQVMVSQRKPE